MTDAGRRYSIEYDRSAVKELKKLDRQVVRRIRPAIDALAEDPRPVGSRQLVGQTDLLRIRVGDYRVIYTIQDKRVVVLVLRVAHRREVYRTP